MDELKKAAFTIEGRLPGLNELIAAERSNRYRGAKRKREGQAAVMAAAASQLHGVRFRRPVFISFLWVEKDRRRDLDNIAGFGHKVILDALVALHVLADDGWDEVGGFQDDFQVDKKRPRIEVTIEEVANG